MYLLIFAVCAITSGGTLKPYSKILFLFIVFLGFAIIFISHAAKFHNLWKLPGLSYIYGTDYRKQHI